MIKFPIPPEYCLVLNAFNQSSTLRGAAILLGTDPASLVRKVQKLSSEYGYMQKFGNRWALTEKGKRIAQWTDEVINSQIQLQEEKPRFRISVFGWLAEEMLIPEFPKLEKVFGSKYSWSVKMTAAHLEQEIIQSRSDYVIQGHAPNDPAVAHKKIATYPWVVVAPIAWHNKLLHLNGERLQNTLKSLPFIRHSEMNPERTFNFKPDVESGLMVDGVIGLRSAVVSGLGWAAVPAMSVKSHLKDRKIFKVPIETKIEDQVSVWWLRARRDTADGSKIVARWVSEFKF